MAERFLSARPHGPRPPLFPRKQRVFRIGPGAVQGAKRRSEPLTARTDLESFRAREKGLLTVSINRYICIYLYCYRASSSAAKRLACQVAKAVDGAAGTRVAVPLAADTTG